MTPEQYETNINCYEEARTEMDELWPKVVEGLDNMDKYLKAAKAAANCESDTNEKLILDDLAKALRKWKTYANDVGEDYELE